MNKIENNIDADIAQKNGDFLTNAYLYIAKNYISRDNSRQVEYCKG